MVSTWLKCTRKPIADASRLDLFDFDTYFTRVLPFKALHNSMLRVAIAAVAAKQIGLLMANQSSRAVFDNICSCSRQCDLENVDWFYKAANYYDQGISFLRLSLHHWTERNKTSHIKCGTSAFDSQNIFEEIPYSVASTNSPRKRLRLNQEHKSTMDEDLLAAISVFSLYESLDSHTAEWSQ